MIKVNLTAWATLVDDNRVHKFGRQMNISA
jgi:hypothetical protein